MWKLEDSRVYEWNLFVEFLSESLKVLEVVLLIGCWPWQDKTKAEEISSKEVCISVKENKNSKKSGQRWEQMINMPGRYGKISLVRAVSFLKVSLHTLSPWAPSDGPNSVSTYPHHAAEAAGLRAAALPTLSLRRGIHPPPRWTKRCYHIS